MRVETWTQAIEEEWDAFVPRTAQGVFLHTRRFLAYHKAAFDDRSLALRDQGGRLIGALPAARLAEDEHCLCSHPGATYGGLLFEVGMEPERVLEMCEAVCSWSKEAGFRTLRIKTVPWHIKKFPTESDVYALWRRGARLVRRDLWNVIDLRHTRRTRKGHRWAAMQARRAGISVLPGDDSGYGDFHTVLHASLEERHGVRPVHSLADMHDIQSRFQREVQLWTSRDRAEQVLAGAWIFKLHERCWHTQYLASSAEGRKANALTLLIDDVLNAAAEGGVDYFSFGASTSHGGSVLNDALFNFKSGFGHGSVCQDTYEIDL